VSSLRPTRFLHLPYPVAIILHCKVFTHNQCTLCSEELCTTRSKRRCAKAHAYWGTPNFSSRPVCYLSTFSQASSCKTSPHPWNMPLQQSKEAMKDLHTTKDTPIKRIAKRICNEAYKVMVCKNWKPVRLSFMHWSTYDDTPQQIRGEMLTFKCTGRTLLLKVNRVESTSFVYP
jgi:hypothetical protein